MLGEPQAWICKPLRFSIVTCFGDQGDRARIMLVVAGREKIHVLLLARSKSVSHYPMPRPHLCEAAFEFLQTFCNA